MKRKNKKAQIGETMTWIVATLIILGVLFIFIYASIAMAKSKSLNSIKVREHVVSTLSLGDENWIDIKNEMAFIRNSENRNKIEVWISEREEGNEP